mmetsp:Transcript_26183/g.40039  ORF Transcript_26183/g.40039 Transcript_26183/m.40039 type:complete len:405 (+) Transcript_26183:274-1488(+)
MWRKSLTLGAQQLQRRSGASSSFSTLSPADLQKINKTTVKLYRILRKASKLNQGQMTGNLMDSDLDEDQNTNNNNTHCILLQPPLSKRAYGHARKINANSTYWCEDGVMDEDRGEKSRQVLSFYAWWAQYMNDNFSMYKQMEDKISNLKISRTETETETETDGDSKSMSLEELMEKNIFISDHDLKAALRDGFRLFTEEEELDKLDILDLQRFAIESLKLIEEQKDLWYKTSIFVDREKGLRVTATSSCIGTTAIGHLSSQDNLKNRFCYRVRVENFNQPTNDDANNVFQLLGRTWKIIEDREMSEENEDDREFTVNAPNTGVVGKIPVIKPGEAFEYMSSCDLGTQSGTMKGCFHMAIVDDDTECAQVGDPVEAFHASPDKLFELNVAPFRLIATGAESKFIS